MASIGGNCHLFGEKLASVWGRFWHLFGGRNWHLIGGGEVTSIWGIEIGIYLGGEIGIHLGAIGIHLGAIGIYLGGVIGLKILLHYLPNGADQEDCIRVN